MIGRLIKLKTIIVDYIKFMPTLLHYDCKHTFPLNDFVVFDFKMSELKQKVK